MNRSYKRAEKKFCESFATNCGRLSRALNAEPLFARVYKWKSAMAQYSVGHLERLQRIESLRQNLPGLALAGNGYNGIGVPDCVRSGTEAAGKILAEMGMWSSA